MQCVKNKIGYLMNLKFTWKRLEDLTTLEFYHLIKVRESVFVVEQQCAYQETDELDLHAWHLSCFLDNELIAYCRVVEPGLKYDCPSIGRVLTIAKHRNKSIGRSLMAEAIRFTEQTYANLSINIGAQVEVKGFYESFDFKQIGQPYDDAGIMHIDMIRTVQTLD